MLVQALPLQLYYLGEIFALIWGSSSICKKKGMGQMICKVSSKILWYQKDLKYTLPFLSHTERERTRKSEDTQEERSKARGLRRDSQRVHTSGFHTGTANQPDIEKSHPALRASHTLSQKSPKVLSKLPSPGMNRI